MTTNNLTRSVSSTTIQSSLESANQCFDLPYRLVVDIGLIMTEMGVLDFMDMPRFAGPILTKIDFSVILPHGFPK